MVCTGKMIKTVKMKNLPKSAKAQIRSDCSSRVPHSYIR